MTVRGPRRRSWLGNKNQFQDALNADRSIEEKSVAAEAAAATASAESQSDGAVPVVWCDAIGRRVASNGGPGDGRALVGG